MRVLAVDPGSARVGLAVSDPLGLTAQPLPTARVASQAQAVRAIVARALECAVDRIIVGHPLNMNGSAGPQAQRAQALAEAVREQSGVPVVLWDERLTSVAGERAMLEAGVGRQERRRVSDVVAAQLLLQHYLDSLRDQEPEGRGDA